MINRRVGLIATLILSLILPVQAQTEEAVEAARQHFLDGNPAAAAETLETVGLFLLPPEGAHLLGQSYQAMLRHEQAIKAFRLADTTQVQVLADLGRSLERIGYLEQAQQRYRAAYRQDSTNQPVAASLARLYAEGGAWGEVVGIYTRLLEEDPENSYLHAQLGTAYARIDSTQQAIIHYETSHQANKANINVVLALTKIYHDIDYLLSARRVIDRALDERPQTAALWRRSGEIALKEETYDQAVQAFTSVLRYSRDTTAIDLRNLGISQYLLGTFEAADGSLQASYDADTTDALGTFYLGLTKQILQRYDEALFYLDHAALLSGQPMVADIHSRIANTYDQMDRTGDAIASYRLALNLDASRKDIFFHLGALYDEYYADKTIALEHYEQFLASIEEGRFPRLEDYARRRVSEIKEQQFFEQGRSARPPTDTSEATPSDTARTGGHNR